MGVRVGAAASYASSKMSNSQSVYVLAQASKMGSAPLALPSTVPPLTKDAVGLLKSGTAGIAAFGARRGWGPMGGSSAVVYARSRWFRWMRTWQPERR